MKKTLILILAMVMTFSLAACGGDEVSAPPQNNPTETETPANNADENTEVDFVSMNFGNITINVPSVFKAVEENGGMYVSAGPNASITVTPAIEVELLPTDWDESLASDALEMLYGNTYSNLELAAFEGDVNMNGNTAVYYAFYGTNAKGEERLAQVVQIYNADLTAQYAITFIHSADDEFYTPDLSLEIINSITLAPEAQNLPAEIEG
jgi:ABC-type glycerol-3-phosphate transport system substrate-binding protein